MSRRNRTRDSIDWPLPWQIELALAAIGLICAPFGMYWLVNEITDPIDMLRHLFNAPVNAQPILRAFAPMIWIFGVIIGWRACCWLRQALVEKLNKIL